MHVLGFLDENIVKNIQVCQFSVLNALKRTVCLVCQNVASLKNMIQDKTNCSFKNIVLTYFVFLCGFSRTFGFHSILMGFSAGQDGHTFQRSYILVAFKRPDIGREHSLVFFIEFDRSYHATVTLIKSWNWFV